MQRKPSQLGTVWTSWQIAEFWAFRKSGFQRSPVEAWTDTWGPITSGSYLQSQARMHFFNGSVLLHFLCLSLFASATQFLKPSSPSSCSFCFTIRNMLWSCHVPVDFLCTKKHASLVCSSTVHLIFPEILAAYQGFAAKWCFDIWKYMDNIFSTFVNIWHAEVLEDEVHHSRVVDHYPASILVNISFLKLRVYMEWECGFQQFLKQSIYSEYIQERVPAYVRLQQLVQTAVGFEICTQLFDSVWS